MPLVKNSDLPSFTRLREGGSHVISADFARQQDIRELHVGLLNMMPDKALEATERQFLRLIGESSQIVQLYVHPFTFEGIERSDEVKAHIANYYRHFDEIKAQGLDALIVTGANVAGPMLENQPFWEPLIKVLTWAKDNVTSILCSCLATHAVMQFRYNQNRYRLPTKRWGVFAHHVVDRSHPLVADVNTRFDVPHSRYNAVDRAQFEQAGLRVLVVDENDNVHLVVSSDGFRLVLFQGHPEYDAISLLKEYKREIKAYIDGERDYPVSPENYFSHKQCALLNEYQAHVVNACKRKQPPPNFPEQYFIGELHNTWHDTAKAVLNNWIGKVYEFTDIDRLRPFKPGLDLECLLPTKSN